MKPAKSSSNDEAGSPGAVIDIDSVLIGNIVLMGGEIFDTGIVVMCGFAGTASNARNIAKENVIWEQMNKQCSK